ncbi:MAG: hypothetical protein ACI8RD_005309, partial [Bacillariaceae sp.]
VVSVNYSRWDMCVCVCVCVGGGGVLELYTSHQSVQEIKFQMCNTSYHGQLENLLGLFHV